MQIVENSERAIYLLANISSFNRFKKWSETYKIADTEQAIDKKQAISKYLSFIPVRV